MDGFPVEALLSSSFAMVNVHTPSIKKTKKKLFLSEVSSKRTKRTRKKKEGCR